MASAITFTDYTVKSSIERVEADCLKKEEELPLDMREAYRSAIRSLITDMSACAAKLRAEGKSFSVIESYVRSRCEAIHKIAAALIVNKEACLKEKYSTSLALSREARDLEACTVTFDSAEPLLAKAGSSLSLRLHPVPLPQTDPALPRALYGMTISDGTKTTYATDPLAHLLAHVKTGADFTICVEDSTGCKDISFPKEVRAHLVEFLKRHPDASLWNCANFAAASQGEYKDKDCPKYGPGKCEPVDFHTGERKWDFARFGRVVPEDIKPGDYIGMEGGCRDGHAALYLGEGFYLSKMGYDHGLAICRLEDMLEPYQKIFKFTSKPRTE